AISERSFLSADAELIARPHRLSAGEDDLDELLALHGPAGLVLERCHDGAGLRVDDFSGRRVGVAAVEAEGHPTRLVAELDARDLPGRHRRRVEDVQAAVGAVREPDLLFVGREADAVARAAVALDRSFLVAGHLDAVQHLARPQVPDLEAEKLVDVYESERLGGIDGEGPDELPERSDRARDR